MQIVKYQEFILITNGNGKFKVWFVISQMISMRHQIWPTILSNLSKLQKKHCVVNKSKFEIKLRVNHILNKNNNKKLTKLLRLLTKQNKKSEKKPDHRRKTDTMI